MKCLFIYHSSESVQSPRVSGEYNLRCFCVFLCMIWVCVCVLVLMRVVGEIIYVSPWVQYCQSSLCHNVRVYIKFRFWFWSREGSEVVRVQHYCLYHVLCFLDKCPTINMRVKMIGWFHVGMISAYSLCIWKCSSKLVLYDDSYDTYWILYLIIISVPWLSLPWLYSASILFYNRLIEILKMMSEYGTHDNGP